LDELLETVLVPETWFFRYPDAYHYLSRYVSTALPHRRAFGKIRILSVPCSTGEEPYSIAMTLLDSGMSAGQFQIDAADVSATALEKAQKARYTQNSFRGTNAKHPGRYFEKDSGQFQLRPEILRLVRFFHWNVQERPPAGIGPGYDIIFCRNLFIYFHRPAQKQMISTLKQLLDEDGLLFSGHAEAGPLLSPDFQPIPPMKAFVHKR
jgi:chemotaxis protein methyltransferase WspC